MIRIARHATLAFAIVVAGLWAAQRAGFVGAVAFPAPPPDTLTAPADSDFVGAEACAECHAEAYARWRRSTHGRAGGPPTAARVIAAFDGRPIRFSNAEVTPRQREGVYQFVVRRDGEETETWPVSGVIGGGHMEGGGTQGFVTQRPDGTLRFLPFDWSRQGGFWFCNTNARTRQGWVRITSSLPLEACGDWPPVRVLGDVARFANCQSCHASQLRVQLRADAGRYETRFASLTINCESCHGPGRAHVERMRSGGAGRDADVGLATLGALTKDASLRVCFQCHAVNDALRDGFGSGAPLEAFYSLGLPALGDRPLRPDGRTRTFAYQEGHRFSACYVNGGMTCTSCHEPHGQSYQDQTGAPLVGRFDDRQCTGCHASKADAPSAHTHHAPASPGSRCVSCHMPYLPQRETGNGRGALGVRYARSDHTISIPRPALDSAVGVRGACAECHPTRSVAELEQARRAWWGEPKPLPAAVQAQVDWHDGMPADSAWPLLLGTNDGKATGTAVLAAGVARWFDSYARPGIVAPGGASPRLRALAANADADVRALALASLHLSDGTTRSTRRLLRAALRQGDAANDGVRDRWRVALGYAADRLAAANDPAADVAYRAALELAPRDPRIWLNRANALQKAGAPDSALVAYRFALELDRNSPLAWLNYGVALGAAGDTLGAERALRQTIALEPGDALAYFNLGNLRASHGDLGDATAWYALAVSRDPSLVPAHFQLARLSLLRRDGASALRHLRRALVFDSSNAAAVDLARQLSGALGRR